MALAPVTWGVTSRGAECALKPSQLGWDLGDKSLWDGDRDRGAGALPPDQLLV